MFVALLCATRNETETAHVIPERSNPYKKFGSSFMAKHKKFYTLLCGKLLSQLVNKLRLITRQRGHKFIGAKRLRHVVATDIVGSFQRSRFLLLFIFIDLFLFNIIYFVETKIQQCSSTQQDCE